MTIETIPPARVPLVFDQNGQLMMTNGWYRYFAQNEISQIGTINTSLATMQATIDAQAELISTLNQAISTIRDVAILNALTSADEIPDLYR